MLIPSTLEDIERMVHGQVQESIHLDYKASGGADPNRPVEIGKDVSSFANSDGGVIVYGVKEEKGIPLGIDEGVDPAHCSKERLEDIITSHITPRLSDVRIIPLLLGTGRLLYVVSVAKSFGGPHQVSDKKYYKRHNFKSAPMDDYEINDVRNRPKRVPPLVTFEAASYARIHAVFDVANVGEVAAEDVRFEFSTDLVWPERTPYAFEHGIQRMPPRQRLRFLYHAFPTILREGSDIPASFSVKVSYIHPDLGSRQSFDWHVDLNAYRDSMSVRSDAELQADQLLEQLKNLNSNIDKLRSTIEPLRTLGGATGLDLSIWTLRNLGRVLRDGSGAEPLPVAVYRSELFEEVLGVDRKTAYRISQVFGQDMDFDSLRSIPGITDELLDRIKRCFVFTPKTTDADPHDPATT